MVPLDSRLEIEAMVQNRDIGFVRAGQEAEIKVDTFRGELVYAAHVSLDRTAMAVNGREVPVSPGMAVTVEIKTGAQRVIAYLLSLLLRSHVPGASLFGGLGLAVRPN